MKTGKAILVQNIDGQWITTVFGQEVDLIAAMEVRGYEFNGIEQSTRLRAELQGQPKFKGVHLCYGGADHPVRYETYEVYEILSQ